jgi:hypothetical protein
VSQLAGLGLGAYGASKLFNKGGEVRKDDNSRAGLNELALMKMGA